jgi:glucuronokinase
MNENFDLRRRIMHVSDQDVAMVEAARALGASAKLTGSGGAIIGAFEGDAMKDRIERAMDSLGAQVIEPTMAVPPPPATPEGASP